MRQARQRGFASRLPQLGALAIPCLAGLAYLAVQGAPAMYLAINAGAFVAAALWIVFGGIPTGLAAMRLLSAALIALLALPLFTGPYVDGVARWLSLGGFTLHMGMVVIPLLAVLLSADKRGGPGMLVVAVLAAFAQPDAASALALSFAGIGIAITNRSSAMGAAATLGLFASIGASFSGGLPPQPFVEGILSELWDSAPVLAAALCVSLLASLVIVLTRFYITLAARLALAGAMSGFVLAALLGDYPYPLIGYGAASILGFGLGLGSRFTILTPR